MATVHQVADGRPVRKNLQHGLTRLFQAVEQQQREPPMPRQRLGATTASVIGPTFLRSDQQTRQVQVIVGKHVEQVIAAAIDGALGLLPANEIAPVAEQAGQPVHQFPLARIGVLACAALKRLAPRFHHRAVGQNDLERQDVATGGTVLEPAAPCSIDGDHAAHGRHAAAGGVRAEQAVAAPQERVEPLVHDSRLHANPILFCMDHAAQMLGEVNDQARSQRLAGHAGAGPTRVNGDSLVAGIAHAGHHVGCGARTHDAQRPDFVDASVAGIEWRRRRRNGLPVTSPRRSS